jgi:hypothetical protein
VWDENGELAWQYGVRPNPIGPRLSNPFNKPDFAFAADGRQELVIRRTSFLPSVFQILQNDSRVGEIRVRSLVRLKYGINLEGFGHWTFHMPPFAMRFTGHSATRPDIWSVLGASKMEWNILIRAEANDPRLIVALAFIHNEWWNYS